MARKSLLQRRTGRPLLGVETRDDGASILPRPSNDSPQKVASPSRSVVLAGMASLRRDAGPPEGGHGRRQSRFGSADHPGRSRASLQEISAALRARARSPQSSGSRSPGWRSPGARSPMAGHSPQPSASTADSLPPFTSRSLPPSGLSTPSATPRVGTKESSGRAGTKESSRGGTKASSRRAGPLAASSDAWLQGSDPCFGGPDSKPDLPDSTWKWTNAKTIIAEIEQQDRTERDKELESAMEEPFKTAQDIDKEFGSMFAQMPKHEGTVVPPTAAGFVDVIGCKAKDGEKLDNALLGGSLGMGASLSGGSAVSTATAGTGSTGNQTKQGEPGQMSDKMASTMARVRGKLQVLRALNVKTGDLRQDAEMEKAWEVEAAARNFRCQ